MNWRDGESHAPRKKSGGFHVTLGAQRPYIQKLGPCHTETFHSYKYYISIQNKITICIEVLLALVPAL